MKRRNFIRSACVRSVNDTERRIEAVASTEAIDSFDTILLASGWDLSRYADNPVLLYAHDLSGRLPVGHCENVRVEGSELLFTAVFDDTNDFDRQVWEKYKRGVLRGFSVRFCPVDNRVEQRDGRDVLVFTRQILMEISCTPVPSNSQALRRSANGEAKEVMRRFDLMKALREQIEGEGTDDEKKAARELYEAMGGDEAFEKMAEEEKDPEGEGEGEDEEEREDAPTEDRPDTARGAPPRSPSGAERSAASADALKLATRIAHLEAKAAREEVRRYVDKHSKRFTPTTRAWALKQPIDVVRSYVQVAPDVDLRAPTSAPGTRGIGQGENESVVPILPEQDAQKLDRLLGITRSSESVGFSEFDPTHGVVRFNAADPAKLRDMRAKSSAGRK